MTLQLLATRSQSMAPSTGRSSASRSDRLAVAKQGRQTFYAIATLTDSATAQCRALRVKEGLANAEAAYQDALAAFGPAAALTQAVAYTWATCLILGDRIDAAAARLEGIDPKNVAALAGDPNWGANLDLAKAQIAFARRDDTAARKHLDAAKPGFSVPKAEAYSSPRGEHARLSTADSRGVAPSVARHVIQREWISGRGSDRNQPRQNLEQQDDQGQLQSDTDALNDPPVVGHVRLDPQSQCAVHFRHRCRLVAIDERIEKLLRIEAEREVVVRPKHEDDECPDQEQQAHRDPIQESNAIGQCPGTEQRCRKRRGENQIPAAGIQRLHHVLLVLKAPDCLLIDKRKPLVIVCRRGRIRTGACAYSLFPPSPSQLNAATVSPSFISGPEYYRAMKPLMQTNPYRDRRKPEEKALYISVKSSSAIEGIRAPFAKARWASASQGRWTPLSLIGSDGRRWPAETSSAAIVAADRRVNCSHVPALAPPRLSASARRGVAPADHCRRERGVSGSTLRAPPPVRPQACRDRRHCTA